MNWKLVFPILASYFRKKTGPAYAAESTRTILKEVLHEEVLSLIVKVMFGLIVTAVVIMSLIFVGQTVNRLFFGLPEGPTLSILVFGALAAGGIWFLARYYKKRSVVEEAQEAVSRNEVSKIAFNFIDGFRQGSEEAARRRANRVAPTAPVYRPETPPMDVPKIPDVNQFPPAYPRGTLPVG